jgi:hypothetical protein
MFKKFRKTLRTEGRPKKSKAKNLIMAEYQEVCEEGLRHIPPIRILSMIAGRLQSVHENIILVSRN